MWNSLKTHDNEKHGIFVTREKSIPQSSHVTIVTLIVVISAAFGCRLPCAPQTHFTQIPLRARKTSFPKHIAVHCPSGKGRVEKTKRHKIKEVPVAVSEQIGKIELDSTLGGITSCAAAVELPAECVRVRQQPPCGAVHVTVTGTTTGKVAHGDAPAGPLRYCHPHN